MLTNIDNHIYDLTIIPTDKHLQNFSLSSDHSSVSFKIDTITYSHKKKSRYVYNFNKADFEGLNNYLFDADFSLFDSQSTCDIDSLWLKFKQIISSACTHFVPKVKLRAFQPPMWFNSVIRHKLNCVRSLRRRVRRTPTPSQQLLIKLLFGD